MTRPRWNLSDLMLLVLVCGLAFAGYRLFWDSPSTATANLLAFLACLSLATVGSFLSRPRRRRAFQGFAAFGWSQLTFAMLGGFGWTTGIDARRITEGSRMCIFFGVLCAILAVWFFDPAKSRHFQGGRSRWSQPVDLPTSASTP
jgi:FtsH-binding integral membrane protein